MEDASTMQVTGNLLQNHLLKKNYGGGELALLVREAKNELDTAQNNFDNATDKTLVDLYIYQLKVAQLKYKHVLRLAKEALLSE